MTLDEQKTEVKNIINELESLHKTYKIIHKGHPLGDAYANIVLIKTKEKTVIQLRLSVACYNEDHDLAESTATIVFNALLTEKEKLHTIIDCYEN